MPVSAVLAALRTVHLQRDAGPSIRGQLAARLAGLIRDGLLPPGTCLPSLRRLASDLGIHRNTVWAAYRRLEMAGLVIAVHGSGVYVEPVGVDRELLAPGARPAKGARNRRVGADPLEPVLLEPWKSLQTVLECELRARAGLRVRSLHPDSVTELAEGGRLIVARRAVLARLRRGQRHPGHTFPLEMAGGSTELAIVSRLPAGSVVAVITCCASVRRFARTLTTASRREQLGFTSPRPENQGGVRRAARIADIVFADAACRGLVDGRRCRRLVELNLLAVRSVRELRRAPNCRAE